MYRTPSKRTQWLLTLVLLLAVPAACENGGPGLLEPGAGEADLGVAAPTTNVAAHVASFGSPSTLTSFDPFSAELPESIAVDRFGNLYVSMPLLGEIWKLDPSGSFREVVATFPVNGFFGVSGLRFDAGDNLYATNGSVDADVHGVWRIGSGGEKERIAGSSAISIPNDLAFSPDGTLYITDSAGAVWRVLPGGAAEMWVQAQTLEGTGAFGLGFPIGAGGIVHVPGKKMPYAQGSGQTSAGGLVVGNAEKGQVVYVPILPDGSAGQPTVVIADPSLIGLDGITRDARGAIYAVSIAGNRLVRISTDGTDIAEIVSGAPLDFPAGLTFGTGPEQHTLFVVNSGFFHFLSDPPMPGNANPAVIAVPVGAPGASNH
jgi:sugar lactone lactonase YvrE